jgi:hypothetical protein
MHFEPINFAAKFDRIADHWSPRIMLIEPRGVVNTGDAGGSLTAGTDAWV